MENAIETSKAVPHIALRLSVDGGERAKPSCVSVSGVSPASDEAAAIDLEPVLDRGGDAENGKVAQLGNDLERLSVDVATYGVGNMGNGNEGAGADVKGAPRIVQAPDLHDFGTGGRVYSRGGRCRERWTCGHKRERQSAREQRFHGKPPLVAVQDVDDGIVKDDIVAGSVTRAA